VFCGTTKQNHRSQCSGNSKMITDNLRQMLKASKRGIQSLQRLAVLLTLTEVAGPLSENTWREIDYRLDFLRATKEAHFEVY